MQCQMGIMRHRSEHNRIFGCIRDGAKRIRASVEVGSRSRAVECLDCQNRSDRECHGKRDERGAAEIAAVGPGDGSADTLRDV